MWRFYSTFDCPFLSSTTATCRLNACNIALSNPAHRPSTT
jgi:hypothetical protein